MISNTKLSFIIAETNDCKNLAIADISTYNAAQGFSNATIQIVSPFSKKPVELDYKQNGVTFFNSNNLKITNVQRFEDLQALPDGVYTGKISICPEDQFWFERTWYRTCQLQCKYEQALLSLNISECENCYNPEKLKILKRVKLYIEGIKANTEINNIKEANNLYKASTKLLDKLIDCEECFKNGRSYTVQ